MKLTLPYPPTINTYYATVRGRRVLSKRGREFKKTVSLIAPAKGLTGRLKVAIDLYPPDRRKRDIDNVQKPVLDALTEAGVWGDDSQVDELSITRREIEKGGRCEVTIKQHGEVWRKIL